jgi:hypothetical protein
MGLLRWADQLVSDQQPAVSAGDGMSACYDGLATSPAELELFAFDAAAQLGGFDGCPEWLGHLVDDL